MEDNKKIYRIELGQIQLKDFQEKMIVTNDWVNWGSKNDFPDVLLQLLYNSSTHFRIVNKRKDLILGDGVVVEKTTNKNAIATENFIQKINRNGETLEEIIDKIAFDFVTFGQSALQVIWGAGGNRITEIFHFPVNNIRYGKKDKYGNINRYFYSENWKKFKLKEFEPFACTPFSPIPEIIAQSPTQILLIKPYSPGCSYYTHPSYVGGLNYIHLSWQMSEFAQASVRNGCFPSIMITTKNMPDDEKDYFFRNFESQYIGANNANKVLINFVEDMNDLKVDVIDSKAQTEMIKSLNDLATTNILQAHGCPGVLVGIAEAGKLGETNEINNSYLDFEAGVIVPDRNIIINSINKLLKINGMDEVKITNSTPIPFQGSEELWKSVLTINEIREMLGYKNISTEEYKNITDKIESNISQQTPQIPQ